MATFETLADQMHVTDLVKRGYSYTEIASLYQSTYPNVRGLSSRSVRRYCKGQGITKVTDEEVVQVVRQFVSLYGHTYGRKMMQGSIRALLGVSCGVVSQKRIAAALRFVAPRAYQARARDLIERTNPVPYYAPYFGYKAHLDQSEKNAQQFGLTHVSFIDGCSRFVASYASMPVKNPILVYEYVYKPAVEKYGLWDQIRTDHGKEFVLINFIQDLMSPYRYDTRRQPYRQTVSTKNYVAERLWPEINSRVNYPLKRALTYIVENFDYQLDDPVFCYCLSWISLYVSSDAVEHFINSWNYHRIPGANGCVPVQNMMATKRTAKLPDGFLPSTPDAVKMYEANGGRLTRDARFGIDPLSLRNDLFESRDVLFRSNNPTGRELFSRVVHGDYNALHFSLECFYNLTLTLCE